MTTIEWSASLRLALLVEAEEWCRNQKDKVRWKVMIMSEGDDVLTMVLNALHWDLAVPRHRLKVEVENGWVTISGMVDRRYQRTSAESDARRVPGVAGVINQIRVTPAQAEQGSVGN